MLCLYTEYYVKRAHTQFGDAVAIRKTASVEERSLERDVGSPSGGMDATDGHVSTSGTSVGIVPILMRYCMSFSSPWAT
jgi:hypothetical protein